MLIFNRSNNCDLLLFFPGTHVVVDVLIINIFFLAGHAIAEADCVVRAARHFETLGVLKSWAGLRDREVGLLSLLTQLELDV